MNLFIKNADTSNHTYQGQLILPGEYHEVEAKEYSNWKTDSDLIKDIANDLAIVSKSNSSGDEISGVSQQIDYLKNINQIQKTQTVVLQDGLTRRPKGYQFTASKNSTTTHYFLIDEAISLRGGSLECDKNAFGDYYSFDIEDKDGNVYSAGYVISKYIDKQNIRKNGLNEMEDESISEPIPANLFYFKITYTSVGTVDDVKCNLDILGYI